MSKKELRQKENNKGITLIALVITIIVMLILVGVSVTVALNGGLFSTAQKAAEGTNAAKDKELALSGEEVQIDGLVYASMDDYLNKNPKLASGWSIATDEERAAAWPEETVKNENVTAIKEEGTNKIVPLPKGFQVSLKDGENTVSEGLVITDGANEFVWIPSSNFASKYLYGDKYIINCSEPTLVSDDTQDNLNKYYGTKEDGTNYYTIEDTDAYQNNIENTFAYKAHYEEMVKSVNKYKGFYIGRYETTIEGSNVGSKKGATVLTADAVLKGGTNPNYNNLPYFYMWWGLYAKQRSSNVAGNGSIVQTNMVWGQQWEAMITYFENESKDYSKTPVQTLVTTERQNAGEAKYTYNGEEISDEICNIYDLRGNEDDWTAEANLVSYRVGRGGNYVYRQSASFRQGILGSHDDATRAW